MHELVGIHRGDAQRRKRASMRLAGRNAAGQRHAQHRDLGAGTMPTALPSDPGRRCGEPEAPRLQGVRQQHGNRQRAHASRTGVMAPRARGLRWTSPTTADPFL